MKRMILVASLLVTFAIIVLSIFGGGMVFTTDLTSSERHRQPLAERGPFEYQVYSKVDDHGTSISVGRSRAQGLKWNTITDVDKRDGVAYGYSPHPHSENKYDGDETLESMETILGRIDATYPEWNKKVDICYTYGRKKSPVSDVFQEKRRCKKRLPEALVIGVKKCGTGTLSRYLDLHPAVSMSTEKSFPSSSVTNVSIAQWIQRMPLSSPYQLAMTENPAFFNNASSCLLDFKPYLSPSVKFLVILRDPVDRAISDYLHHVAHSHAPKDQPFDLFHKNLWIRETFEKTVLKSDGDIIASRLISIGLYINSVEAVLEVYRRDQFLFIDGDAFTKDPYPTMLKVEEFLGLPKFYRRSFFVKNDTKGFYCAQVPQRPDFGCMIPSKGRPHPKISDDALRKLQHYYRPFNKALADRLGLNFSWID